MNIAIAVLVGIVALVHPSAVSAQTVINACVHKKKGSLRIVADLAACGSSEDPLSWNEVGPPGPEGPQGPEGPPAPLLSGPPELFPISLVPGTASIRNTIQWGGASDTKDESGEVPFTSTLDIAFDIGLGIIITGSIDATADVVGNTVTLSFSGSAEIPPAACCTGAEFNSTAMPTVEFVTPHFGSPMTPILFKIMETGSSLNRFTIQIGAYGGSSPVQSQLLQGEIGRFPSVRTDGITFGLIHLLAGDSVSVEFNLFALLLSASEGASSFSHSLSLEVYAIGPNDAP